MDLTDMVKFGLFGKEFDLICLVCLEGKVALSVVFEEMYL